MMNPALTSTIVCLQFSIFLVQSHDLLGGEVIGYQLFEESTILKCVIEVDKPGLSDRDELHGSSPIIYSMLADHISQKTTKTKPEKTFQL
jgi:hypothetical protein